MPTLKDVLLAPDTRPTVVRDCEQIIQAEVADKKGVSGLAIKAAFKTVTTFKKGIIPDVVDILLDDFVTELEPFYAEHRAAAGDLRSYLVEHADRIADALLRITDQRADRSRHATLVKAYKKLRPQGQRQVADAMPRIAAMLQKHGL